MFIREHWLIDTCPCTLQNNGCCPVADVQRVSSSSKIDDKNKQIKRKWTKDYSSWTCRHIILVAHRTDIFEFDIRKRMLTSMSNMFVDIAHLYRVITSYDWPRLNSLSDKICPNVWTTIDTDRWCLSITTTANVIDIDDAFSSVSIVDFGSMSLPNTNERRYVADADRCSFDVHLVDEQANRNRSIQDVYVNIPFVWMTRRPWNRHRSWQCLVRTRNSPIVANRVMSWSMIEQVVYSTK
jgi:hypothetical protein